jgi:2-polyprenyl-6-methoxyphenol hydroxylase-like FAD-dependent oxidoreductase/sugar lactone lactonase YvrE
MLEDARLSLDTPVLIAGGGPAGLTLAMDLAWRGVESIVIEARAELPPSPRCNTTNARSMEIFRRLGCADAIRSAGLPADNNTDVVYMTAMNGEELTRFRRPTPQEWREGRAVGIGADWPTPEPQHFISQLYMEPPLRKHAVEHHGIDLRLGWDLLSFKQDDHGVMAEVREAATGNISTLRSDYLVGADGSNSCVRRDIGARLEGTSRLVDNVTTFVRSPRLTELYQKHPGWMYRFLGGGIVVAIDGKDQWLLHTQVPPGQSVETYDPEPAFFAVIGERFEYEVINEARWTARGMVVNKYREGRVFLAGDAAPLWIPMGGFGMNSGVGDAAALGWILAGVHQGWLDAKTLDVYGLERSTVGDRVAGQAMKWGRDLGQLLRPEPALRAKLLVDARARADYDKHVREVNTSEWESVGMMLGFCYTDSPVIAYDGTEPPPFLLSVYRESSSPGARAPHLWRAADPKVSLHDQFGKGYTLLRIGATPPSGAALVSAAQARELPLSVLDVPEPEAVAKYQGYGLVLVRPDQHIAWRSMKEVSSAEALGVVERVTGRLITDHRVHSFEARALPGSSTFPEGLRTRRGKLVYADMTGGRVLGLDPKTGVESVLARVPQQPNGLGHLPDGRLVVASMFDTKLYVASADGLTLYADLSALAQGHLGDLVVDRAGGIFVGDVGAKVLQGEAPRQGRLIRVEPDGQARVVQEGLHFPNGMVITQDGNTLLLAETMKQCVLQLRIEPDGSLGSPRPYIEFSDEEGGPDGMTIARDGSIWVCLPKRRAVQRYDGAGHLTARVETPPGMPIACALSADDGTLYIVGADGLPPGTSIFQAIAERRTRGWVMQADLIQPPDAA